MYDEKFVKENGEHEHSEKFVGFTLDYLDEQFSSLVGELRDGGVTLDSVMEVNERTDSKPPYFRDYAPTIQDYLERASTEEECEKIISYCLSKNEITEEEAKQFRSRLKKGGPQAFGTRQSGYYDSKI